MHAENTDVAAVAVAICHYLRDHPNAADTLEGVALWWLSGHAGDEWLATVQSAIDALVENGDVTRQTLRDGTTIYERTKHHDPN